MQQTLFAQQSRPWPIVTVRKQKFAQVT
jgi:hypothetical protein